MQERLIIGITGRKQSGKDTVYQMLIRQLGTHRCIRLAFADTLKSEVADLFGIDINELERRKALPGMRRFLQFWGTEIRRTDNDNYWIDVLKEKVSLLEPRWEIVIVADVRFINEAECIKELSPTRNCLLRIERNAYESCIDGHPSELEQQSITVDLTVHNTHGLTRLEQEVKWIVTEIKQRFNIV